MDQFSVGDRVCVLGKHTNGTIAYVGKTHFSEGEWYGIVLDDPKGRNNGSVGGKSYFKCTRNYGIFVRSCQLAKERCLLNDNETKEVYPDYLRYITRLKDSRKDAKSLSKKNLSSPKKLFPDKLERGNASICKQSCKKGTNSEAKVSTAQHALKINDVNHPEKCPSSENLRCTPEEGNKHVTNSKKTTKIMAAKPLSSSNLSAIEKNSNKIPVKLKGQSKEHVILNEVQDYECVVEKLKCNFDRLTEGLSTARNQTTKGEDKLEILKDECKNLARNLDMKEKVETDLRRELLVVQEQHEVLRDKLLKHKLNLQASEKRQNKLELKLEVLREVSENVIIEKEIAEENNENLQLLLCDEVEKCKRLEVDIDILKEEIQIQCIDGEPAVHYVKELEHKNAVLTSALYKLNDMYNNLKDYLTIFEKEIQLKSAVIISLEDDHKNRKCKMFKYEKEVSDLHEIVDGYSNADDIIFEIMDRNLKLEEELRHVYQELDVTEEHLELSEETCEILEEFVKMYKEEIDRLDFNNKTKEDVLNQKNLVLKSKNELITKYGEHTRMLRNKIKKLSEQLQASYEEKHEAVCVAECLKLNSSRIRKNTLHDLIQLENSKIDLDICYKQLKYWSLFLPSDFFDTGSAVFLIETKLIMDKLLKKLDLLVSNIKSIIFNPDTKELHFILTVSMFLMYAYRLQCLLTIFTDSFERIDLEQALNLGNLIDVLNETNSEIVNYLWLLCKNEIDTKNSINSIANIYHKLSEILDCKYAPPFRKLFFDINCYLQRIYVAYRCIFLLSSKLAGFETGQSLNSRLNRVSDLTKMAEKNINSILRLISNSTEDKIYLQEDVIKILEETSRQVQDSMKYFIVFHDCSFSSFETADISYPADEKISSLDTMVKILEESSSEINKLKDALQNGHFVISYPEEGNYISPIVTLANQKKQKEQENVSNLHRTVLSYELEIINLSKSLQRQQRSNDETHKNLHVEIGSDLQVTTTTQTSLSDFQENHDVTIDYLLLKLEDMESAVKYLHQKNFELRILHMKEHQLLLKPLRVLPKMKFYTDVQGIGTMLRKTKEIMSRLTCISVPRIVDVTGKSGNKVKAYKNYLANRLMVRKEIEEDILNMTYKIKRMENPGSVWSNFLSTH